MKKRLLVMMAILLITLFPVMGHAWTLDFEEGTNGANVAGIPGVVLLDFNGYNPIYGYVMNYNTYSDDLNIGGGTGYHMMGYYFVWASAAADAAGVKVDFTNNDGTWFETGFSSSSTFYIDAYLTDGTMITVSAAANTYSPMGYLKVEAPEGLYIDYVVLHDSGNHWLVDNMSGDASGVGQVPEPATMLLLGMGLLGIAGLRKKFKK